MRQNNLKHLENSAQRHVKDRPLLAAFGASKIFINEMHSLLVGPSALFFVPRLPELNRSTPKTRTEPEPEKNRKKTGH
jgi:hypothetical protein